MRLRERPRILAAIATAAALLCLAGIAVGAAASGGSDPGVPVVTHRATQQALRVARRSAAHWRGRAQQISQQLSAATKRAKALRARVRAEHRRANHGWAAARCWRRQLHVKHRRRHPC